MHRALFVYQLVAHGVDIFLDLCGRDLRQMAVGFNFFQIEFCRPQGVLAPLELRLVDIVERFPGPDPVIKMIQLFSRLVPGALHDCLGLFLALLQLRIFDLHLFDEGVHHAVIIEEAADLLKYGLLQIVGVDRPVRADDFSLAHLCAASIVPRAYAFRVRRRAAAHGAAAHVAENITGEKIGHLRLLAAAVLVLVRFHFFLHPFK